MDVEELADFLNRSVDWVHDEVARGRLPVIRVGRFLRFDPRDIDAYLAAHRTGPTYADSETAE